jgi:hypothetical protein
MNTERTELHKTKGLHRLLCCLAAAVCVGGVLAAHATVKCGYLPPGDNAWPANPRCFVVGAECIIWKFTNENYSHSPCKSTYFNNVGCDEGTVHTTIELWKGACSCVGKQEDCCRNCEPYTGATIDTFASWRDDTGCN